MASWGGFWNGFAKVLTTAALWAASHPDVVIGVVNAAKSGDQNSK